MPDPTRRRIVGARRKRALRGLLSLGLLGCVMLVFVPLGCAAKIVYPATSQGPRMPDATAERLRACVDEVGGALRSGHYMFDYKVLADREGRIVDVEAKGVPNADLVGCTRIALRGMTVPEELLRIRRMPEPLARSNERATPERGPIGEIVIVTVTTVTIVFVDLIIEAGLVTMVFAVTLEIAKDVAEAIQKRPNWKKRCDEALKDCLDSPLQRKPGSVEGSSLCLWCREKCTSKGWPKEVEKDGKLISCVYDDN